MIVEPIRKNSEGKEVLRLLKKTFSSLKWINLAMEAHFYLQ